MPGVTRTIVVNAPREKVFDVLIAYEKYGDFLPEVKKVSTSNRQGTQVNIHYEVELLKTLKYTVRMQEEKPNKLAWSFVEGEVMRDNTGSWVLEDAGPNQTKVTYNLEVAFGPLIPKAIINPLVDSSLPKMLENFKKYVESH